MTLSLLLRRRRRRAVVVARVEALVMPLQLLPLMMFPTSVLRLLFEQLAVVLAVVALLLSTAELQLVAALENNNGLAKLNTPPMGYLNFMAQKYDNSSIKGEVGLDYIADFLQSSGLQDLGYTYIIHDEGWELSYRNSTTGELIENPTMFPNGLALFVETLHHRGFKFGLYSSASEVTCGTLPGQLYHEILDVNTYINKYNVDYIKVDNCANFAIDSTIRYKTIRDAILLLSAQSKNKSQPILSIEPFSITPTPMVSSDISNLWRTSTDIQPNFESIMYNANIADKWSPLSGPNNLGWNDPDMIYLQNSPNLTVGENRIYFALWCLMKSPLILSADLPKRHRDIINIISNKEVIEVNRDVLGIQGRKIQLDNGKALPWLVGVQDCSIPDGSLNYMRRVATTSNGNVVAGPGHDDVRKWTLLKITSEDEEEDDQDSSTTKTRRRRTRTRHKRKLRKLTYVDGIKSNDGTSSNNVVLIQHDATKRCLAVLSVDEKDNEDDDEEEEKRDNGGSSSPSYRVVLLPCSSDHDDDRRFLWRFDKGYTTISSITNVYTNKVLALSESFLYSRQHGKDIQNVSDLAYGTNKLQLLNRYNESDIPCTSRYCQNYDPKQLWYYSFVDKTIQHGLYTSSMNHIENYRDHEHENGWILTPKVPTFRYNCLSHILSEDNIGTESGKYTEVWGGPLSNNTLVVGLVNLDSGSPRNITANLNLLFETSGYEFYNDYIYDDEFDDDSPNTTATTSTTFDKEMSYEFRITKIRDLWNHKDLSLKDALDSDGGSITLEIPSHDMAMLKLYFVEGTTSAD